MEGDCKSDQFTGLLVFHYHGEKPNKNMVFAANSIPSSAEEPDNFLHRSSAARRCLLLLVMLMLSIVYSASFGCFCVCTSAQHHGCTWRFILQPSTGGTDLPRDAGARHWCPWREAHENPLQSGAGLVLGKHSICSLLVEQLLVVGKDEPCGSQD